MDELFKLVMEAGSTVVMLILFMYMVVKLPKQVQEALDLALKPHAEALQNLALAVDRSAQASEKAIEQNQKAIQEVEQAMKGLTVEVHKLTVLTHVNLVKHGGKDDEYLQEIMSSLDPDTRKIGVQ